VQTPRRANTLRGTESSRLRRLQSGKKVRRAGESSLPGLPRAHNSLIEHLFASTIVEWAPRICSDRRCTTKRA
jgi:hypothetical protein